jgi:hypothetical protein
MKDIFIDNDFATRLSNPIEKEYTELIKWLLNSNDAYLVIDQKLLKEYADTCGSCNYGSNLTNIWIIVSRLQANGRWNRINKKCIESFKSKYFTSSVRKILKSNYNDREWHIPSVFLSDRHLVLSLDNNFKTDLSIFPKFSAISSDTPSNIPYK